MFSSSFVTATTSSLSSPRHPPPVLLGSIRGRANRVLSSLLFEGKEEETKFGDDVEKNNTKC